MTSAIASPAILTHYLTEMPDQTAKMHDRRALMWNIAAKVMLVALFAIGTAVLAFAILGTSIIPNGLAFMLFGLVIGLPLFTYLSGKFEKLALHERSLAQIEHGVADQLKLISGWKQADIDGFFQEHKLGPAPQDANVLPLIARFLFWKATSEEKGRKVVLYLNDTAPDNYLQNQNREMRFETRSKGWEILEYEQLPAKLQSALCLQLIADPTHDLELEKIGKITPLSIGQRLTDISFENADVYFEFADINRPPLKKFDVENLSIDELRTALLRANGNWL